MPTPHQIPDPGARARARLRPPILAAALLAAGCSNHYLIHPKTLPAPVVAWSEEVDRGKLRMRLEWARPAGDGPFPAVIVHPEANHVAKEMRGILRSLALEGYLAVAADYRRQTVTGRAKATPFVWRERGDVRAIFDLLLARPELDPARIGALGYSQGGIYSLLIAAETQQVGAVVAYYPITDFATWLDDEDRRWMKRQVFKLIRRYLYKRSGAGDAQEFAEVLERASPLRQAERLEAPVLLIHGDSDTSAPISESRRLERRLRELGREVEVLEVEDAGHVFNFRDRKKAGLAWEAATAWLAKHLR